MLARLILWFGLSLFLVGCGAPSVWAPDDAVRAAAYRDPSAPSLTLITVINNRSGDGAHSALLVNASQRVLFDPAGSWYHSRAPERNDVFYGMTPRMVEIYTDYHARETHHVVMQTLLVSPETAQEVLRRVETYGAVSQALCARSVSSILRGLPGLEGLGGTPLPLRLMRKFDRLPNVQTTKIFDDDHADHSAKLAPVVMRGQ